MKESRQIVQLWRDGGASVLVTLVRTAGSSYRQPGARLLLGKHSAYAGTISGGCLELEVLRRATWLVRAGAVVERYSTLFDDTAEIPFGLGCGGVVDLLLEPADTPEGTELLNALERALAGRETIVLTWLPDRTRPLARAVLSPAGEVLFASESLPDHVLSEARAAVLRALPESPELPEGVFLERLLAPQRLFVLGAGDDAKPMVSLGALLGWTVKVLDGRPGMARAERFPEAASVSIVTSPALELREIGRDDAVVLMTHSYEQDREMLAAVLPLRPRYFGMLGARHRTSLLITEVAAQLGCSVAACCEHLQAPVGLNLGGDGPEVIALAVIAEIQASLTGQQPNSRKLSAADVEGFVARGGGSARYERAVCATPPL